MRDSLGARVHGVAALDHPVTAAAYRLVREHEEVSRDDAAAALEVPRSVAAFHLDKLVDAGLAEVRFERLTGRTGPGAGRTAKVYRRSAHTVEVSLPERHYDFAGELLASAVERAKADGTSIEQALRDAALDAGRAIGRVAKGKRRAGLVKALEDRGYEPVVDRAEIALRNCPFHTLAQEHRELVCGMNLDFISGVVDGAGADRVSARLESEPGYCCVRLSTR